MVSISITVMGISIRISMISVSVVGIGISISLSISISTTLATCNMLERVSSTGVELADSMDSSVVWETDGNSVVSVESISWLSASLAPESLRRSGFKGGSKTGVGSNTGKVVSISIGTESISIGKISWLSVSISAALVKVSWTASVASGGAVWGAYSRPVGVGVVEGRHKVAGFGRGKG